MKERETERLRERGTERGRVCKARKKESPFIDSALCDTGTPDSLLKSLTTSSYVY